MSSEESAHAVVQPANKAKIKKIWTVALILGVVTALEFVVAFTMAHSTLRTSIFLALTLVKAVYIVGEFMHLKYEVKVLIWSIMIPLMFVVWLIIALLIEGNAIFDARNFNSF